jgi:hypothetical protein
MLTVTEGAAVCVASSLPIVADPVEGAFAAGVNLAGGMLR